MTSTTVGIDVYYNSQLPMSLFAMTQQLSLRNEGKQSVLTYAAC